MVVAAVRFFPLAAAARLLVLALVLCCVGVPSVHALRPSVAVQLLSATPASLTSPAETRAGFFSAVPVGRFCFQDFQSLGIAAGCEGCAYETASGRRRWPNGDPLREGGGINLFQFCSGDPINRIDPDGRLSIIALSRLLAASPGIIALSPALSTIGVTVAVGYAGERMIDLMTPSDPGSAPLPLPPAVQARRIQRLLDRMTLPHTQPPSSPTVPYVPENPDSQEEQRLANPNNPLADDPFGNGSAANSGAQRIALGKSIGLNEFAAIQGARTPMITKLSWI